MKRRAFFTAAAACLLAVSISGCGSTNGNDNAGDSARSEPETNEATPASTAFGQKSVWMQYSDDQISKDTGVERILVFDGKGNVTVYDTRGIVLNGGTSYEAVRFGELDGLSDDEIIDLAKKKDRERFDATKQSAIDETNEATPASTAFGQKSVWMQYSDDQISKDTGVERILVFDGKGNVTVYDTRGIVLNGGTSYEAVRFGELDGLSDDEIIDLAKKKDRERFDATKQSAIDETNEDIESFAGMPDHIKNAEEGQKVNEAAEYQEPKAVPFTLKLETDGTGNSAASETLSFEHQSLNSSHFYSGSHIGSHPDRYADEALYKTEQVDIKLFSPTYSTTSIVYDTTFGGYSGLATVVNEGHAGFTWDTPDTEGIEVD